MKEQDVTKYMDLMDRRMNIVMQSDINRRSEYSRELAAIDQELMALRQRADLEAGTEPIKIPRMMTIKAASRQTGLSYDCIRKLCAQGKIIHIRVGAKFLVNLDRLIEYLNVGDMGAGQQE